MITADTITDEEIRKALRDTKGRGRLQDEIRAQCRAAFADGPHEAAVSLRRRARSYVAGVVNARARYAEILNARAAGKEAK